MQKLGLTEESLHLAEPPSVKQDTFEEADGTVHLLPRFRISWRQKGDPVPEEREFDFKAVTFEISGVTKNVAEYSNFSRHTPADPLPADYFQMLDLPANYLETLPEKTRLLWGLPPLTNPSGRVTNSTSTSHE